MIHTIHSMGMLERRNMGTLGTKPRIINDFKRLKFLLEHTNHIFTVILIPDQHATKALYEKYGIMDYVIHKTERPLTNHNYPDKGRRLELFILKGKGEINEV